MFAFTSILKFEKRFRPSVKLLNFSTNSGISFVLAFFRAGREEDFTEKKILSIFYSQLFNRSPDFLLPDNRHQNLIYFSLLFPVTWKLTNIFFIKNCSCVYLGGRP